MTQGHRDSHGLKNVVPVLMAGGVGTRFWPLSTPDHPKQFLTALSGTSFYRQSADRARALAAWDRILVMTNARFTGFVEAQTPEFPARNVVLEPRRRDTAAAVILAAVVAEKRWPGCVMVVMPADHVVDDVAAFRATVTVAVGRALEGGLGTIGIAPTHAATGFGYLRLARKPAGTEAVAVEAFTEKPDLARAEKFVASGAYLWNSGMFIWRASALLEAAARHLPAVYGPLASLGDAVGTEAFAARTREVFDGIESISVDFGIMEKAGDVWAVPAIFHWRDVGGWLEAADLFESDGSGNRTSGPVVLDGSCGNVVVTDSDKPIVVAGLSDCIIVRGPAGMLVCTKQAADRIKPLVEQVLGGKRSRLDGHATDCDGE